MQIRNYSFGKVSHIALLLLAVVAGCSAQSRRSSPDDVLTVGPTAMLTNEAASIVRAMDLSPREASAFWPIYESYEAEKSALDACRTDVVEEYGDKYLTMSNDEAKAIAKRMFDCDFRLIALKKKYFKKFSKVLPAYTVTKFFQLENRVEALNNRNLESTLLPPVRSGYGDLK